MGPIDYSTTIANPLDSALKGYQTGIGINQLQLQQQQQQAAMIQQQQQQQVIRSLITNPDAGADEYSNAALLVPGMHEQLKQSWDTKNKAQQQTQLSDLSQWGAALQNGQPQMAIDAMTARAEAMENTAGTPTRDSQALRAQADAIKEHPEFGGFMIKSLLAAHPNGKAVIDNIVQFGKEQRDQEQAAADLRKKNADAGGAESDAATKKAAVIGQTMGALQGKNVKPEQIATAFKSLAARGVIGKDELPVYLADIPADAKELPAFLNTYKLSGMTPNEQMKYSTPSADATLSAQTQRRGQDIQQKQYEQDNLPAPANETMAKQIAFYKAAPLGQFSLNKPWGQSTMDRVMQLNPEYDAAQYAPRASALKSYAAGGKESLGIDSINIGMNHIDTLRGLALAQKNGNIKQFNRLANAFATQTGNPAPTNLRMATDMVAPEIVKAVTGVGGTGEERAHFGESLTGKGSYGPDQVLGALDQVQDLFAGRLKEKKRSYERSTKLNNFEDDFLSPTAKRLLQEKGAPAKAHPADIDQLLNKYGGSNG